MADKKKEKEKIERTKPMPETIMLNLEDFMEESKPDKIVMAGFKTWFLANSKEPMNRMPIEKWNAQLKSFLNKPIIN